MAAPTISRDSSRLVAIGEALTEANTPANFQDTSLIRTQQQIVQYINEGNTISTPVFGIKNQIRPELLINAKDGREHTVVDFLQRPINFRNFEWTAATAQFKVIQTFDFPNDFLNLELWREKFDGFYGLRADIKFRLQVNAQPFQAGRLMLVYVPYQDYLGDYASHYTNGTEATMVSASGCPHIDLDISLGTEVDMLIPYCSPHSHFNLATGEGMWGKLHIFVYSPLSDLAGTGHVDCTAWINLENVDLAFPTGATLVSKALIPSSSVTFQVGKEEQNLEKTRSISQDIGKLSGFLKSIPTIPVLSDIIQPATWACDGTAAFLKFFGYSKLQSTNVPEYVKPTPSKFMSNYDGVDMSHSLALASDNAIELMPDMVGNDIDEMSLHHIVSTPCYYTHFKWEGKAKANDKLWEQIINPAYFYQNSTNKAICPTHLTYTSSIFQFWRGSIDITLKFIKTKFHSGRVRIFFQPGTTWPNGDNVRRDFNYSQVIDIRSQTDVVFRVPFVATHPWLTVGSLGSAPNRFSTTGVVRVEVLNELVGATTVASDIDVLVEISAGPDFELAGPSVSTMIPMRVTTPGQGNGVPTTVADTPSTATASTRKARSLYDRIVAQVGEAPNEVEEQAQILNKDQLGEAPIKPEWINNLSCIGEKVTSVRQLIKRSAQIASEKADTGKTVGNISIAPFNFQYGLVGANAKWTRLPLGYLDYFAHIYAFWRGGVNLKLYSQQKSDSFEIFGRINLDPDQLYQEKFLDKKEIQDVNNIPIFQIVPQNLEGIVDLAIPYYSAYHMCPVSNLATNQLNDALGLRPKFLLQVKNINSEWLRVYRSATDSFQFGYLIGPPICCPYTAT